MDILKNISQIGDKFNCLVKDQKEGLVDIQSFIENQLDSSAIKELASSLDKLEKKQLVVEDFSELLFQLRDYLPSVGNFIKILLICREYESIVYFVKKIFINQIGIIKYQSTNGTYSFSERYFDRFIEIVKNCKIEPELYIPFVAKIVASNENSILYQWIKPAKEYVQIFFNQNEEWVMNYINSGKELKYEIIEAACDFNTIKGVSILIKDFLDKQNFLQDKSESIIKEYKKDVITYIDKLFTYSKIEDKLEFLKIYSLFLPDIEVTTRLKEIYEEDKNEEVKNQIASILGITDTLSIKTEKQFLYAVKRKVKDVQERALGVVFDKLHLKLKSGYECDNAIYTFIVFLLKEEKNLANIKKLKVLENILEIDSLREFAEQVYDEVKIRQDILCAKWALRFCALLGGDEKANEMADFVGELFRDGRKKEANYLALCLIYSGREEILGAIKVLNQINPDILGELKDAYAEMYAMANNKNIEDVYDDLVEDNMTDDSVVTQTTRLFEAFISGREYTEKRFEKLFMTDNVLGKLATRLVWGEYNFKRLYNCFKIVDGEKKYIIKTSDISEPKIQIAHSLDLDERFDDVLYAISSPLFEQFRRSTFNISSYSSMSVLINRFSGMFVSTAPYIEAMKEFGFVPNINDGDEFIPSLVFAQKELGMLVEVDFDKPVLFNQEYATLSNIYFYRLADIVKNGEKYNTIKTNAISVGGVGERLFDFSLNAVSVSSRRTH